MKEIITFFGGDSKVGTTMTMQCFSEELAARGNRVLMIFASSEPFDAFLDSKGEFTIDSLREIEAFGKRDVKKLIYETENLSYIKGCDKFLKVRYFLPNILEQIISNIRDDYDYITIDGGHNYQYPLPIAALKVATKRYFVLQGSHRTVTRFDWLYKNILMTKNINSITDKDEIILNFIDKEERIYTSEMLEKIYGRKVFTIPRVAKGELCESSNCTLLKSSYNGKYKEAICKIVNTL